MSYNTPNAWANIISTVVPDMFRHTTTDDLLYSLPEEGGDGFTVRPHESYGEEEIIEENRVACHFATESEAERWAWGWMREGDIDEASYYSPEALALIEALEGSEWQIGGRIFSTKEMEFVRDGSLDAYNEELGRCMIRLVHGDEARWFDTCSEAHMFLCLEADWSEADFNVTSSTLDINEGIYTRYAPRG